MVGVA
jgi:hypothetical protein